MSTLQHIITHGILAAGIFLAAFTWAESPVILADAVLDSVLAQLPTRPVEARGNLLVRKRRGVPIATYKFVLDAHWQDCNTRVAYTILDESGVAIEKLVFTPGAPTPFTYFQGGDLCLAPLPDLRQNIGRTDLSWGDLTLYFLWWRGARHVGTESVRGFPCHILAVDAPPDAPPGSYASVRLWISKEHGMLLQAEGLDEHRNPVRRLWVQSVRQIENEWMIQTLEVQQSRQEQRTRLHVLDVNTPTESL